MLFTKLKKKTLCTLLAIALLAGTVLPTLSLLPSPTVAALDLSDTVDISIGTDTENTTYTIGNGTATWDKTSNTLTLENVAPLESETATTINITGVSNPTIQLNGTNIVQSITATDSLTIIGEKSELVVEKLNCTNLTLRGDNVIFSGSGFTSFPDNVTIDGGTLMTGFETIPTTLKATNSPVIYVSGSSSQVLTSIIGDGGVLVDKATYVQQNTRTTTGTITLDRTSTATVTGNVTWNDNLRDLANTLKRDVVDVGPGTTACITISQGATLTFNEKQILPKDVFLKNEKGTINDNGNLGGFVVTPDGNKFCYTAYGKATISEMDYITNIYSAVSSAIINVDDLYVGTNLSSLTEILKNATIMVNQILSVTVSNPSSFSSLPSGITLNSNACMNVNPTNSGGTASAISYYLVNVINGTSDKEIAAPGTTVTITATDFTNFQEWQVNAGNVTVANATAPETTFVMPNNGVQIEAISKATSSSSSSSSSNSSSGNSTSSRPKRRRPTSSVVSTTSSTPSSSNSNQSTDPVGIEPFELDTQSVNMAAGGKYSFLIKGLHDIRGVSVATQNPEIATVTLQNADDERGAMYEVTAHGVGTTQIVVTINGGQASMEVRAMPVKKSLMIDTSNYTFGPGQQYTIGAILKDANGEALTEEEIAQMLANGSLSIRDSRTGSVVDLEVQPNGNAKITAKNPGTCYIIYQLGETRQEVRIDVAENVNQAFGSSSRKNSYLL